MGLLMVIGVLGLICLRSRRGKEDPGLKPLIQLAYSGA